MDKKFAYFNTPDEKYFKTLWKNCIFVFDTNTLLNLYRYSATTAKDFLKILKNIKLRIWLPYQVGFEYHNHRIEIIESEINKYDAFINRLAKIKDDLNSAKAEINKKKSHPHINSKFIEEIQTILGNEKTLVEKAKEKFGELQEKDFIQEDLNKLFHGKIGDQYTDEQLKEIINEGKFRYENEIPPGFEDSKNKVGIKKYGDLIIWLQMIDKAKESKKPFIFVTDDEKSDWWKLTIKKNINYPRPELIKEFKDKSNFNFYMYHSENFMNLSQKYLKQKVAQQSINEVKETRIGFKQQLIDAVKIVTENMQNNSSIFANSFQNIKDYSEILSLNNLYLNPKIDFTKALTNFSSSPKFNELVKNIEAWKYLNNNSISFIGNSNLEIGDNDHIDNKEENK